jgi:hypothetical protein
MFSRLGLTIVAVTLALACGACTPTDVGFGETVKYAAAVQTIDPDPVYGPDSAQPGDNGEKAAQAVKRYRTDKVKPVETYTTSSGTAAGGGGGPQ